MGWSRLYEHVDIIRQGLYLTLLLSSFGIGGSFVVGTLVGVLSTSTSYLVNRMAAAYVEVMRNVPLLVKLFFFYFVAGLDALPAAIVSLVVHQSGFIADVTAAGLRSVPQEQFEAGFTTGLSKPQIYVSVLLPQAIRHTLPPLTNQFIELVKNTAAVSLIGLQDLTFGAQDVQVHTYRYLEAFIVVTALYVAMNFTIAGTMEGLRRWMATA